MKHNAIISANAEIFEVGFAVRGPMYSKLPSYRCYLPDCWHTPPLDPR